MSRPPDLHAKIDLLRAAEEVFREHGVDKARIEDITDRAKRSKGAFYLHFDSKEEAFRQIVESFLARLQAHVEEATRHFERDVADLGQFLARYRDVDAQILEFLWQNRGVVRLMLEGGGGAQFGYLIDEFAERSRENTKRLLQWSVREGLYRADLDLELASLVISGAYDRVARQLVRMEKKPNLSLLVGELQKLLMAGVAATPLREIIDSKVKNTPKHNRSKRS